MGWFRRFMMGRAGADQLTFGLVAVSLLCILFSRVTRWRLFYILAVVVLAVAYYRMFSRDTARRYEENRRFLRFWEPISLRLRGMEARARNGRAYRYFKCPGCGQKIRAPRGRGRIVVTCPSCRREFEKRT